MAWIESHQNIKEHKKTYRLMAELGCSKRDAISIVHMIWWWCLDNALEGRIEVPPIALKAATEWEGDADKLVDALLAAEWLERHPDGGFLVHDWTHYCGALVEKRLERKQIREQKAGDKRRPKVPRPVAESRPTGSGSGSESIPKTKDIPATNGAAVKPPKPERRNETATPFWTELIAHIDTTWSAFKRKKTGNAVKLHWEGRFFKTIASLCGTYQTEGVMALWDIYLEDTTDFVRNSGYSIPVFEKVVPRLLDNPAYKSKRDGYGTKLYGGAPPDLNGILAKVETGWKV